MSLLILTGCAGVSAHKGTDVTSYNNNPWPFGETAPMASETVTEYDAAGNPTKVTERTFQEFAQYTPIEQEVDSTLRISSDHRVEKLLLKHTTWNTEAELSADQVESNATDPITAKGEATKKALGAGGDLAKGVGEGVSDVINPLPTP